MRERYEVVEIRKAHIAFASDAAHKLVEQGGDIQDLGHKFEMSVDLLLHLFPLALKVKMPYSAREIECAIINELIKWIKDHNASLFLTDIKSIDYVYLT